MSDATITSLVRRAAQRPTAPRDCGVARVVPLPARATGRLIEPLAVVPSPRADVQPLADRTGDTAGPLARALRAMESAGVR